MELFLIDAKVVKMFEFDNHILVMTLTDHFLLGLVEFIVWAKWLFIAAFALTLADLRFGIAASKYRHETIRRSRAIRRTIDKVCSYILWVIIAYTFGKAFGSSFGIDILPVIILIVIYGVELESIFLNYFEAKGRKVKVDVFKIFKKKVDIIEIEEIEDEDK